MGNRKTTVNVNSESELMDRVRGALIEISREKNMSFRQLVKTYNLPNSTVNYILRGRACTAPMIELIASRLGMSVYEFLKVDPRPTKRSPPINLRPHKKSSITLTGTHAA